jgi:hypothetical protein
MSCQISELSGRIPGGGSPAGTPEMVVISAPASKLTDMEFVFPAQGHFFRPFTVVWCLCGDTIWKRAGAAGYPPKAFRQIVQLIVRFLSYQLRR